MAWRRSLVAMRRRHRGQKRQQQRQESPQRWARAEEVAVWERTQSYAAEERRALSRSRAAVAVAQGQRQPSGGSPQLRSGEARVQEEYERAKGVGAAGKRLLHPIGRHKPQSRLSPRPPLHPPLGLFVLPPRILILAPSPKVVAAAPSCSHRPSRRRRAAGRRAT